MKLYILNIFFFSSLIIFAQAEEKVKQKNEEQNKVEINISNDSSKVVWASKLIDYSSQYSKRNKSALQILGKPNVMPAGGESNYAWAVKEKKGKEKKSSAYIHIGFEGMSKVQQILIAESFNPGSVKSLVLYGKSKEQSLKVDIPLSQTKNKSNLLYVFLDEPTNFVVESVKLYTVPGEVDGRNEIDAIALSDSKDTIGVSINIIPDITFEKKAERLGKNINSKYDEIAPIISPDGNILYFDRMHHPSNSDGERDSDDIWYSVKDTNGEWTISKNIGKPLNNNLQNFVQSVTPDGNTLLLANEYYESGLLAPGISLSHKTKEGWSFPKPQKIEKFKNKSRYANYYLTNDGRFLLMAINNKESQGKLDLYMSERVEDNKWSQPKNLGKQINTSGNDYSPFLSADGTTLYFSSDGYSGYGDADIYRTERLDNTWSNWSEPQNLGPDINTKGRDSKYNLPANGEYAYFTSTNNTIGGSDIFRIKLPSKVKLNPVVMIKGFILDKNDSTAIDATIIVETLPEGKEVVIARTDPKDGSFSFILQPDQNYGFRAIKEGYYENSGNINIGTVTDYEEVTDKYLMLDPIKKNQTIVLKNIFFDFAKATLRSESIPELERLYRLLTSNPNMIIEISGHTDNKGSRDTNIKLSKSRAKSVVEYLVNKGINESRLEYAGYAFDRPIATNETEEGRQLNRRVEFKILEK